MKLTKVEFIVKGEKVTEYINLNHVSRFMWIDGVPFVGMVGQTFTRQLADEYETIFIEAFEQSADKYETTFIDVFEQ